MTEDFGTFRSILHSEEKETRWQNICAHIDSWPDTPQHRDRVQYAFELLKLDHTPRMLPEHWLTIKDQTIMTHVGWPLANGLNASHCALTPTHLQTMIDQNLLTNLQHIDLSWNPLGNEGLKILTKSDLHALESLHIQSTNCTADGLIILAQWSSLARVHTLSLKDNVFGDEGFQALVQSPYLGKLKRLELESNHIGPEGIKALIDTQLNSLCELVLCWQHKMADEGTTLLVNSPLAAQLTYLDLNHNNIGDVGAIELAKSTYLKNLKHLILYTNFIGNDGAKALAQSPNLQHLESLYMHKNEYTEQGKQALVHSPYLPQEIRTRLSY